MPEEISIPEIDSYGYSLDCSESVIHLRITNDSIIKYYIEECKRWFQSSQIEPPPHPFAILDKITRDISSLVEGSMHLNRYSERFRKYLDYFPINGMGVFDHFVNNYNYHCFGYQVDTRGIGKLKFEVHGDFFEPEYPHWSNPVLEYKYVEMKTKEKHEIRFGNFGVRTDNHILVNELKELAANCPCNPKYFIPNFGGHSSYLQYICPVCGRRYFCDCFLHLKPLWDAKKTKWSKLPDTGGVSEYRKGICHVCRGVVPPPVFVHKMYGSFFMQRYAPWIFKELYTEKNMTGHYRIDSLEIRKAENILRKKLGVYQIGEKWITETAMYYLIRTICGDRYEVIHHARPKFLNGMEYDVYIPELQLAFEYDGIQHEKAVSFFGGEESLKKTRLRDNAKDLISKESNIRLVRIKDTVSDKKLESIIHEQETKAGDLQ